MEVPWVESMVTVPVRPFMIFSERGRAAVKSISDEHFERLVLDARMKNDTARSDYLTRQAANALGNLGDFGIQEKWLEFYANSMDITHGKNNYPPLSSIQGFRAFIQQVYLPLVESILSSAEIASVMGDNAATKVTAQLEAEMEIILAGKRAEVAEKIQPAQRRIDDEVMKTRANEAKLHVENEEVLKRSKKIRNELAMRTVIAPISASVSEGVEAVSEAAPSFYKGFAEFLKRWQDQEGGDPKLVAVTAGGLAVGLVGGTIGAFTVSWLVLPAGVIVLPLAAAAGYMAVRGFMENSGRD